MFFYGNIYTKIRHVYSCLLRSPHNLEYLQKSSSAKGIPTSLLVYIVHVTNIWWVGLSTMASELMFPHNITLDWLQNTLQISGDMLDTLMQDLQDALRHSG